MDLNIKLQNQRFIKFDEKGENENDKPSNTEQQPVTTESSIPAAKPVTASIQDVLSNYAQGSVKFVSMTGNQTLPPIEDGVTEFEYEGSKVTTYRGNGTLDIQIVGKVDPGVIRKKIENLIPLPVSGNDTPVTGNTINGEIDEKVSQGGTGDCWVLAGVLALNSTEAGKQIIKNSIQANPDGSVTVTFKGLGVSYTIPAILIEKCDTDNNKGDAYSNGDNDMLVLELATKKLMADIASGKVKLDVPADSVEAIYNEDGSIEGGFAQNMIYYLTGQTADFIYAYGKEVQGLPQNEVLAFLSEAYKNGNSVMTFGVYGAPHHATLVDGTPYKLDIQGGHNLAITNITATTVTFVNPWDSNKEYTMTWEEFAKLGIGMLTSTDLSGLENTTPVDPEPDTPVDPPVDPVTPPVDPDPVPPTPDSKIYTRDDFFGVPQSLIDKFFEPVGYKADGTPEEWVLKAEYSDIKISHAVGLIFDDGSSIIRDLCITTTSLDENGNEIETTMQYFSEKHLDSYLGGNWWRTGGPYSEANKYFELDEQSGLYMLKEGMSLEELKKEQPVLKKEVDTMDSADPRHWSMYFTANNTRVYSDGAVEENLSEGIIERFFEPEYNDDGEVRGYSLKAPYTSFKLVSNGETERVYEFSYTKDGVKYISTVTIDETDGSYRIKNSTEQVATTDYSDKTKEEIIASILGKMNKV